MVDCVFCRIASGAIPVQLIYEDDEVVAFNDSNPQAPSHALVIPKLHIANLAAAAQSDEALLGRLLHVSAQVAQMLGIDQTGYRIAANVGSDGGQSVDHLHIHLLGGRRMVWPPG